MASEDRRTATADDLQQSATRSDERLLSLAGACAGGGFALGARPFRASDRNLSDACFHARPVAREDHPGACRLGGDGHVAGQLIQRKRLTWAGVSQEGMERIRRAVDAFNRRDVDALLEWNHPDIVYQTAIASMEGEALGDALKWEVSRNGGRFPHLYRPLKISEVRSIVDIRRDARGSPIFPAEIP